MPLTSRDSGLDVYVNVGSALEDAHIPEMKRLGVESITSSFETMNERIFLNGGKIYEVGEPGTVLTPGNIRSVYNVEAEVVNRGGGRSYIIPIRSV